MHTTSETTINEIQEHLQSLLSPGPRRYEGKHYEGLRQIPAIRCEDGTTLSVQTSESHYCHPRDNYGPWFAVEVGFPSRQLELLMPYIDGKDSEPTNTVYGYVPIEIVARVIAECGGFAKAVQA